MCLCDVQESMNPCMELKKYIYISEDTIVISNCISDINHCTLL